MQYIAIGQANNHPSYHYATYDGVTYHCNGYTYNIESVEDRKLIDNVVETNVYKFLDLYTQNSEKDAFDKVISKLANDIK